MLEDIFRFGGVALQASDLPIKLMFLFLETS